MTDGSGAPMSRERHRTGLWLGAIVAGAAAVGALGIWWRRAADPVAVAERAYQQGDWRRAIETLRGPLKDGRATGPAALRTYARSLARLQRDEPASAAYRRLGREALQA